MTSKRSLSPEARSIINSQVSRRALIAGAGGIGAAGLLTACVEAAHLVLHQMERCDGQTGPFI